MTDRDHAIALKNLSFQWGKGAPVIDIEALTIAAGERAFIYGPSGCGKSTLLSLIAGILSPTSGYIGVMGEALSDMSPGARDRFRAEHLGVIFQTFNLLPFLSIIDNVRLGYSFAKERRAKLVGQGDGGASEIGELLSKLGLPADTHNRPVRALSIGQQQRVAVARALIGSPALVIADEPTSALDSHARDRFLDLLLRQCDAAGSTLLFVSHDNSLAAHFDRSIDLAHANRASMNDEEVV
ncbi:MAG: ABC transporter ATP-binding protein [Pseudomonadota bacterium]